MALASFTDCDNYDIYETFIPIFSGHLFVTYALYVQLFPLHFTLCLVIDKIIHNCFMVYFKVYSNILLVLI